MPKLIDQAAATDSPAIASEDANLIHRLTSAWGGVAGECGVECACGVTFDGFDTIAEAEALLTEHIAQAAIEHPEWCDTDQCWAYENASEDPAVGGFHVSRMIAVSADRGAVSLQITQDHGVHEGENSLPYLQFVTEAGEDGPCRHFTLDQAAELYHALRVLVPGLTNDNTARALYELGEKNGRRQAEREARNAAPVNGTYVSDDTLAALERVKQRFENAEREAYKAYCIGWVDGNDGRAPEFGVTR